MEQKRESIFHATLILTAVNLIAQLTGLLCRIGISRLAGAEVMGVYQLILPAYSVLSAFAISGLAVSVSALTGELTGRGQYLGARRVLLLALRVLLVLWLAAAIPTVVFSDFISVAFLGDARTRLGLMVLLPCLLLTGIENIQKHHFYGLGQVRLPAAVELGEQLVRTSAILLLLSAFPQLSTEGRAALIIGGMLCSEIFSASALTYGRHRLNLPRTGEGEALGKRLLEKAAPIGGAALVGSTLAALTAIVVPGRLIYSGVAADQATSVYGVMFGMTMPLLGMPTCFVGALCTVLLPGLSRWQAQGKLEACRQTLLRALEVVSAILLPLLALITVFGKNLGQMIFREERVGDCVLLLAVAVAFTGWDSVLSSALNGLGYQRQNAAVGIAIGGMELLLTWKLVGEMGLKGCAWSMLIGSVGETVLRWLLCRRAVGLRERQLYTVLLPVTAAVLMGLCTRLLYMGLLERGLETAGAMGVCGIFGALFYLLILRVEGGFSREKRNKTC